MTTVHKITTAKDPDAAYVQARIHEADKLDGEAAQHAEQAAEKHARSEAARIEAGKRLIEVRGRWASSGQRACPEFARWLESNGIAPSTASRLMKLAGYTEAEREQVKKKEAQRKREQRAKAYRVGWVNLLVERLGVTHGSLRDRKAKIEAALNMKLPKYFTDEATAEAFVKAYIAAFPQKVKVERDALRESDEKKLQRAVDAETARLHREYHDAVQAEVMKRTAERLKMLEEMEDKAKDTQAIYSKLVQGVKGVMTQDEYKLILNCLHPDRAPEDRRDRFTKAFAIFKRFDCWA